MGVCFSSTPHVHTHLKPLVKSVKPTPEKHKDGDRRQRPSSSKVFPESTVAEDEAVTLVNHTLSSRQASRASNNIAEKTFSSTQVSTARATPSSKSTLAKGPGGSTSTNVGGRPGGEITVTEAPSDGFLTSPSTRPSTTATKTSTNSGSSQKSPNEYSTANSNPPRPSTHQTASISSTRQSSGTHLIPPGSTYPLQQQSTAIAPAVLNTAPSQSHAEFTSSSSSTSERERRNAPSTLESPRSSLHVSSTPSRRQSGADTISQIGSGKQQAAGSISLSSALTSATDIVTGLGWGRDAHDVAAAIAETLERTSVENGGINITKSNPSIVQVEPIATTASMTNLPVVTEYLSPSGSVEYLLSNPTLNNTDAVTAEDIIDSVKNKYEDEAYSIEEFTASAAFGIQLNVDLLPLSTSRLSIAAPSMSHASSGSTAGVPAGGDPPPIILNSMEVKPNRDDLQNRHSTTGVVQAPRNSVPSKTSEPVLEKKRIAPLAASAPIIISSHDDDSKTGTGLLVPTGDPTNVHGKGDVSLCVGAGAGSGSGNRRRWSWAGAWIPRETDERHHSDIELNMQEKNEAKAVLLDGSSAAGGDMRSKTSAATLSPPTSLRGSSRVDEVQVMTQTEQEAEDIRRLSGRLPSTSSRPTSPPKTPSRSMSREEEDVEMKRELPRFEREIKKRMYLEVYKAGDFIIRKHDIGKEMYFLSSGKVEVVSGDGRTVYSVINRGSFFGELGVLFNVPRTASIRAVMDCHCMVLTRENLEEVLQYFPQIATRFRRVAEQRMKEVRRKIVYRRRMEIKSHMDVVDELPEDNIVEETISV
ncbi:Kinesin-like protein kif27 [Blyttiomyces sp. JEL0837]|nr:Kinesin-like protein kif27 [Blyttiomyces sp. JEL0837]